MSVLLVVMPLSPAAFGIDLLNKLERGLMPGALHKDHDGLEKDCDNCHQPFKKAKQDDRCVACHDHKEIAKDIKEKKGFHGQAEVIKRSCNACHVEHQGKDSKLIVFSKSTFNHNKARFALKGAHRVAKCESCHKKDKYRVVESACIACHKEQDVHKKRFGKDCNQCHKETQWTKVDFPHELTKFKLKGKHQDLLCASCHVSSSYLTASNKCGSCHKHEDKHKGLWGEKCQDCHTETSWKLNRFDHQKEDFKLKGKHVYQTCESCHSAKPSKDRKDCNECHSDIHEKRYGDKCHNCHSPEDWAKTKFSHDKTDFKLENRHKKTACETCHLKDQKTPIKCFGCHSTQDVHFGKLKENCAECHSSSNWAKVTGFDHEFTRFSLNASHTALACEDCHQNKRYQTKILCHSCHKQEDSHKGVMGEKCEACHQANAWRVWHFDHDKKTDFKLRDAHKNISCAACHKESDKKASAASSTCIACHFKDDIHLGRFGNECGQCHNEKDFKQIIRKGNRI